MLPAGNVLDDITTADRQEEFPAIWVPNHVAVVPVKGENDVQL
jgi:hypothetical protein